MSAPRRKANPGRDQQYLAYAEGHSEGAELLADRAEDIDGSRIPFFHLVAHAMELMLKAALSHQGYDKERLMMRHGLERCYANAIRGGAQRLDDAEPAAFVKALDQRHSFQAFRHPQEFDRTLPEPDHAMRLPRTQLGIVGNYLSAKG